MRLRLDRAGERAVMDKAEIRAKAERLKVLLDSRLDGTIEMSALNEVIESVLTAAYDAGWNEAVEAAAKKSYFPEAAGGVAGAIRRLRIDTKPKPPTD